MKAKGLEVVFASGDSDEAAFKDYFKDMPWLAIPYTNRGVKDALLKKYAVTGIPLLAIVEADGTLITKEGPPPTGAGLPWLAKPVEEERKEDHLPKPVEEERKEDQKQQQRQTSAAGRAAAKRLRCHKGP